MSLLYDGMTVSTEATMDSYEALLEDLRVANAMMDDAGRRQGRRYRSRHG